MLVSDLVEQLLLGTDPSVSRLDHARVLKQLKETYDLEVEARVELHFLGGNQSFRVVPGRPLIDADQRSRRLVVLEVRGA